MNLWQKLLLLRSVLKFWSAEEEEYKHMNGKALLTSKTFWTNLIVLGVTIAGFIPPQYSVPVLAILNILLRWITDQPITGLISSAK